MQRISLYLFVLLFVILNVRSATTQGVFYNAGPVILHRIIKGSPPDASVNRILYGQVKIKTRYLNEAGASLPPVPVTSPGVVVFGIVPVHFWYHSFVPPYFRSSSGLRGPPYKA